MEPAYALAYRHLHEHHWWWRAREELVLRTLSRLAPPGGFGSILDVGCGDGLLFDRLAAFGEPEGVEPEGSIVSPQGSWADRIHVRPFDHTFRPGRRYGLILMLDVLEHLEDDRAALSHAVSLLAEGGVLVATVPALAALWTNHDERNHHFRRYDSVRMRSLARASGLELAQCRYFFHVLAPVKLAVRFVEACLPRSPRVPAVPPAAVNRLLMLVCRFEQALTVRRGPPFGSSLLAIGSRANR